MFVKGFHIIFLFFGLLFGSLVGNSAEGPSTAKSLKKGYINYGPYVNPGADESAWAEKYRKAGILKGEFGGSYVEDGTGRYVHLRGHDLLTDNQDLLVDGGSYNNFHYTLQYGDQIHKLSNNAKTFYDGVGTGNLTYSGNVAPSISSWRTFDYEVEKRLILLKAEWLLDSPWFVLLSARQEKKEGTQPMGFSSGLSKTSRYMEMPAPVMWKTTNVSFESGYSGKNLFLGLTGFYSQFKNDYQFLNWKVHSDLDATPETDVSSTFPNNNFMRFTHKGSLFRLPYNSSLAWEFDYSLLDNDVKLLKTFQNAGTEVTATTNTDTFTGKISRRGGKISYVFNPSNEWKGKMHARYAEKKNQNSEISYSISGSETANNIDTRLGYRKINTGADLLYKYSQRDFLGGAYDLDITDRTNRRDAAKTTEHILSFKGQKRWGTDNYGKLLSKVSLRSSDFEKGSDGSNVSPAADTDEANLYIHRFVRFYDVADRTQLYLKGSFEVIPLDTYYENWDMSAAYVFKRNSYSKTVIGRKEDMGHTLSLDYAYNWPEDQMRLGGFASLELLTLKSMSRYVADGAGDLPDPDSPPSVTAHNIDAEFEDIVLTYGWSLSLPVPGTEETIFLHVKQAHEEGDGMASFAAQTGGGVDILPIERYGDYVKDRFEVSFVYKYDEASLDFAITLAYEELDWQDLQYLNYKDEYDNFGSANKNSRAYVDRSYSMGEIFLSTFYRF